VARERVAPELQRLFAQPGMADQVRAMADAGVWDTLAPELLAMQGEQQPPFHHLDVWDHTLAAVTELEGVLADLPHWYEEDAPGIEAYLAEEGRPALLKLATLLHDIAKPATRTGEQGRHFYDHEKAGARRGTELLRQWGFGGQAQRMVATLIGAHLRPAQLHANLAAGGLSLRAVRKFFRDTAPHATGVLLLAQADVRATRGPRSDPDGPARLLACHRHLMRLHREQVAPVDAQPPLLTGEDLIRELGLAPGPVFREILEAVAEARLEGEVSDREGALAYVRRRWGNVGRGGHTT
jgi:poly(A) polymerase